MKSAQDSRIDQFVESLRCAEMPVETEDGRGLVNIYDDGHDPGGWRKERLRRFLMLPREGAPLVLFVGEAPGKDGAVVTGVPFASIETLTKPGFEPLHPVEGIEGFTSPMGIEPAIKERTATKFWSTVLPEFDGMPLPVTWNIVPFWPKSFHWSNRRPLAHELRFGCDWTLRILEMWSFDVVVSVGQCAGAKLNKAGIANEYIRHPSHGGSVDFAAGIERVLHELES